MRKILKYVLLSIIIMLPLILLGTKVLAEQNGFSIQGNSLSYNNQKLNFKSFLDYLAKGKTQEGDEIREKFLRINASNLKGINLKFQECNYLLDYRRQLCLDKYKGDSIGHNNDYQISDILDIQYDGEEKCFTVVNGSGKKLKAKDSLKSKIINLCAMIYINGRNSEEGSSYVYETGYGRSPLIDLLTAAWHQFGNDDNVDDFINTRFIDQAYLNVIITDPNHNLWRVFNNENVYREFMNLIEACKNYKQISKMSVKKNNETIQSQENICSVEAPDQNYTTVGPFRLAFNEENGVEKIIVNNVDVTDDVYVYIEKDGAERNFKKLSERSIESEKVFYLAIKNDSLPQEGNEYKIVFKQKALKYHKSRIVLMESMRAQQLGTFIEENKETEFSAEVEYLITRKSTGRKLIIKKVGKQYDTNIEQALQGVELKIYGKPKQGTPGWVQANGNNIVNFVDFDNATKWVTDNIGIANIEHLAEGTYYIYETKTASGYNLEDQREKYPNEDDPNGFSENESYNCVYLGSTEGFDNWKQFGTIKSQYPSTRLTLEKVDSKDENHKISGVQLKIYAELQNKGKGWLGANGSLTYYNDPSTLFTTDENGRVNIDKISKGKYYIYEIKAGDGYDIEEQRNHYPNEREEANNLGFKIAGEEQYNNAVYLDKLEVGESDRDTYQFIQTLEQFDDEPAKLTIRKTDYYDNSKLLNGVEFAIFVGNSGWLGYENNQVTYDNDWSNAFKFKTGNAYCGENRVDGEFTLNNLKYGDYYVVEVSTGANKQYELFEQPGYDKDSNYEFLTEDRWKMITNGMAVESILIGRDSYNENYTNVTKSNGREYNFVRRRTEGQCDFIHLDWYTNRVYSEKDGVYNYGANQATYNIMNREIPAITIIKKDAETGEKLDGAEFSIDVIINTETEEGTIPEAFYLKPVEYEKGKWKATYKKNPITINSTDEERAAYKADKAIKIENGELTINSLQDGLYVIKETKAPNGYHLEAQENYSEAEKAVSCGTIRVNNGQMSIAVDKGISLKYNENAAKYEFEVENTNPFIDLNGKVWVDEPNGKENTTDSLYIAGTNDYLKSGIKVNLYKDNEYVDSRYTNEEGYYEFIGLIKEAELPSCRVEFEYDNTKYICVDTFVGDNNAINSKAKEEIMKADELEDEKLTGEGRAITSPTAENNLVQFFNPQTRTAENINLGLMEKINHSISIRETIEYVKVVANGTEYTYRYPEEATENEIDRILIDYGFSTSARFQTGARIFTPKIYTADVAKNKEQRGFLNVYAVYKIDVTNSSNDTIENKYVEKALYLNSLENEYDKERYTVSKDHTSSNNDYNKQFENWDDEQAGNIAYYKLNVENSVFKDGIRPAETKTTHIQFKVTDKALDEMITNSIDVSALENAPTRAHVKGYHEYLRTDNLWNREGSAKEFSGCKGNYNLENRYFVHKSTEDEAKSKDWYFILQFGKTRTISGTVFEDTRKESGSNTETLGNGILNNGEKNVENVLVELYREDDNELAIQYEVNGNTVKSSRAIVNTGTDGKYEFKGIPTGRYYIQFTYGDGTQKIENASVYSNDYKSTIINTENNGAKNVIRDAIKNDANQDGLWYMNLDDKKYSTAVDDLDGINSIDEAKYDKDNNIETYYKDNNTQEKAKNVKAKTPKITIPIENDKNNNRETIIAFNGQYAQMNTYDKFNFGIIKSPKIIVETTKEIDNVKITNQVGTNIVSANPKDKSASYVSAVEDESGESAKIEIDLNNIYGSSFEATYKLTVENKSEIDYIEPIGSTQYGDYYRFGVKTEGVTTLKTVTVEELQDYLDTDFDGNSIPDEGLEVEETLTTENSSKTPGKVKVNKIKQGTEITNPDGTKTRATRDYTSMTEWSGLERNEKTSITYSAKTVLSSDLINNDSSFTNNAVITKIKLNKLTTLTSSSKWHEEVKTSLTIFGPTGENRSYEAYLLPGVLLLVMGIGVVLIKKYVL